MRLHRYEVREYAAANNIVASREHYQLRVYWYGVNYRREKTPTAGSALGINKFLGRSSRLREHVQA